MAWSWRDEKCPRKRGRGAGASSWAAAGLAVLIAVLPILQPLASAVTLTSINIDGSFVDWQPVLNDSFNVISDRMGADDPDNPPQGDRDFTHLASTWDDTYMYFYYRRSVAGQRQVQYMAYLDLDNDGRCETTDRVVYWGFTGAEFKTGQSQSWVAYYDPVNDAQGDVMTGDGVDMPGALGSYVSDTGILGASTDGIEYECRVAWSALGVAAGTPMQVHFSCGQNLNLPSGVTDNAGNPWSTQYRGITLEPDRTSGASADTTVTYAHTVSNTGNGSETVSLSAPSSQGWTTVIRSAATGLPISSLALAAGASAGILVDVRVPQSANNGKTDVTTVRGHSSANGAVFDTATDTTYVGEITVTPDQSLSMTPGGTVTYWHTVSNNGDVSRTLDLTAVSNHAWTTRIYNESGSQISSLSLAAAASARIRVEVDVPAGTAVGVQDQLTVRASVQGRPNIYGRALDLTTVRPALAVEPDNAAPAGPGTTITYTHTVQNSTATTQAVALTATSNRGWTVRIYGADGVTEVNSVSVGPYGAVETVFVRVTVPSSAAPGLVDTTTLTGSFGSVSDTAVDVTTASRLATYTDANYLVPSTSYRAGDTVYARGMGLTGYSSVKFRWVDANGTTVYTSPAVGVDTQGISSSQYALATTAPVGTWTCILLNGSNNAEITRSTFVVTYDARITALYATDAHSVGETVSVDATLTNSGAQAISGSTVDYLIWWDGDGSGAFDTGDTYIDSTGAAQTYLGSGSPYTHRTSGVGVAAGGTWSEATPWTVSNRTFPMTGNYNLTATWETSGGVRIDDRTVQFYSIPTLGWWLLVVSSLGGGAWLWRRRRALGWSP